jgi:excisionase family DNA binding protein
MDEMTMKTLRSLSSAEVAALLHVDRHTVNAWQTAGKLPYFTAGSKRRTLESDVLKFMQDGGCADSLRTLRKAR